MATPFATLGFGNGFPFCLFEYTPNPGGNPSAQNAPTLEETMSSYWNIDSITFGPASFNPNNEPKDLICTPNAVLGYDLAYVNNTPNLIEFYDVTIQRPQYVLIGGQKYLQHGLNFGYTRNENVFTSTTGTFYENYISYSSTIVYPLQNQSYYCNQVYYGFNYGQRQQTLTTTTISNIPFNVRKSQSSSGYDYGPSPSCQPLSYYPLPTTIPQINLHTY